MSHVEEVSQVVSSHEHAIGGYELHFSLVGILVIAVILAMIVANHARKVGLTYSANVATVVVLGVVALTFLLQLVDELMPFGFQTVHGDHILPIIGTGIFIWLHLKSRQLHVPVTSKE